jgi:dCTP deaminase
LTVLSRGQILNRLDRKITDDQALVISPLLQAKDVLDEDSLDLRLGTHFLLPRVPPQPFFYPWTQPSDVGYQRIHVPVGGYLVVPAHETVLGATLEFVKLPYDLSGQILTKSSVARTFVVIETAPWIHPSYRGCLTLEIANVSNTPLLLYPGRLVAQLILFDVPDAKLRPELSGSYMGPVYPEPGKFSEPRQELSRLGVPEVEVPQVKIPKLKRCPECFSKLSDPRPSQCGFCKTQLPLL